jgi:hypothetical protein
MWLAGFLAGLVVTLAVGSWWEERKLDRNEWHVLRDALADVNRRVKR